MFLRLVNSFRPSAAANLPEGAAGDTPAEVSSEALVRSGSITVDEIEIQIDRFIASGARSQVYAATMHKRSVALKIYFPAMVDKYRRKYQTSIAQFEYQRNLALYSIPELSPFVAEPLKYWSQTADRPEMFIQELVQGQRLHQIAEELGYVPRSTLDLLRQIVQLAAKANLHDIDVCHQNIMMIEHDGEWYPKLFDFNLMPQYQHAPNPILTMLYWLGVRDKSFRDYRHLRNLENWSDSMKRGII